MAELVTMIQLSPTMEEGRLVAWHRAVGDTIETGDLLAEVETDKANMDMESFHDGTILALLVEPGDTLRVGRTMAVIGEPGEDWKALVEGAEGAATPAPTPPASATPAPATQDPAPAPATPQAAPSTTPPAAETPASPVGRVLSSPLARKVAAEHGIDVASIPGSGPAGRIIRRDVDAALQARTEAPAPAAPQAMAPAHAAAPAPAPAELGAGRLEPLSPMRKAIARNLTAAWQAPAFMLTRDFDMEAALALRGQVNAALAASGPDAPRVSVNDLLLFALSRALADVPEMNSAWTPEGLWLYESVDIGVAVALEGGLITPVVRGAHRLSLARLATEVRSLVDRARDRKLKPDEYTGATFSVSNLGMFGIDHFTAVLNPPAAGILAVGAVRPTVVGREDGTMEVRRRMTVTLTCDHRAVDGVVGSRMLQKLAGYLEAPLHALVS
jgi:pyruvate dehydrogenase E2 component (dihydrolipoamide acetyltransferase)